MRRDYLELMFLSAAAAVDDYSITAQVSLLSGSEVRQIRRTNRKASNAALVHVVVKQLSIVAQAIDNRSR